MKIKLRVKWALAFCFLVFAFTCSAQYVHVESFRRDASTFSKSIANPNIIFVDAYMNNPPANARVDRMPDGSLRIVMDRIFVEHFGVNSPQVKRLVYYLLGHELLKKGRGKGIMNSELVYIPMKKKDIKQLFE